MNAKRRGSAASAPIEEAELAAVTPHLFQRPALWSGLALPAVARECAAERPWAAYWALRRGTLADPGADRAVLQLAHRAFVDRGDALGALLACAAAIETYYYDETPLEPLDGWIALLDASLGTAGEPFPNAECGAEVMACGTGILLRQPAHPRLAAWAARGPLALSRLASGPSRIKYAAFVVQHHLWRGEFGACALVIEALPGVDLALLRPPEALLWLHGVAAYARFSLDTARGRDAVRQALALIEQHGLHSHAYDAHAHGAALALGAGDAAGAAPHLDAMRTLLATRTPIDQTLYWHLRSGQALLRGPARDALALARSTIEHSHGLGGAYHGVAHRLSLAITLLACGDAQAAAQEAGQVCDAAAAIGAALNVFSAGLVRSAALARLERHDEADAALREALAVGAAHDFATPAGWPQPTVLAERLARALALSIEPAYAAQLARRQRLRCPQPTLEAWPWPLALRGFGGLEVRVDGQPLAATGARVAQRPLDLLRMLLAQGGRSVAVAQVLEALWPDADFDPQRKAFDAALLRLRRLLGDDSLLRLDGGQLHLDGERCWSDVRALLESDWSPAAHQGDAVVLGMLAERLLGLVRGPLLEDVEAPWALAARERLRRRFVLALAPIAQALEACDAAAACALYERALASDPLAESLARRLIEARLARGERAEALRAWLHCKAMLALYGTAPAPDTLALARRAGLPA